MISLYIFDVAVFSDTGDDDADVSGTASIGVATKTTSKKTKARSMPRLVVNTFGDVEYPDKDVGPIGK